MPIIPILEWIETTELSMAIREGMLYYPIIGGIHLLGIALFGGMLVATDLRLLGWAMPNRTVTDVVDSFRDWKRFGFVVIAITGLLLTWCEPLKLYRSPAFWVKVALLILVGVHARFFRDDVYRNTAQLDSAAAMPGRARLAAALSLALWTGLVLSGRLIAFDD